MTFLYILLGLVAVYFVYNFGAKKGASGVVQPAQGKNTGNTHNYNVHANAGHHSHGGGGCC